MFWIRSLESLAARPLAGTEGARRDPVLVARRPVDRLLRRRRAPPAHPRRRRGAEDLHDARRGTVGADWNREGTILFSAGGCSGRIYSVAATGGEAKPLTSSSLARREQPPPTPVPARRSPVPLRHRRHDAERQGLFVTSLDAPAERRQVHRTGCTTPTRRGTSSSRATAPSSPSPSMPRGRSVAGNRSRSRPPWRRGLCFRHSGGSAPRRGARSPASRRQRRASECSSPGSTGRADGRHGGRPGSLRPARALARREDRRRRDRGRRNGLGPVGDGPRSRRGEPGDGDPRRRSDPVWAPDGRSLAFSAEGDGTGAILRKGLRASEPETVLVDTPDQDFPESWSPDGRTLLFLRLATPAHRRAERLGAPAAAEATRPRSSGAAATSSTSRSCRPTGAGSRTCRASPGATRSTSSPSGVTAIACASPWTAAASPSGAATAGSCSTPRRRAA